MGDRWDDVFRSHLKEIALLQTDVAEHCGPSIGIAVDVISSALRAGGKLLICGNGGSAADCQHLAAELTSRLTKDFDRPPIAAIALTTDTAFLTAYANDYGYEGVFERQVEALGKQGDVLLGISTSGNSENVRRAVSAAHREGMATVALVGEGGPLEEEADHAIVIPSTITAHVQEAMLPIEHVICHAVERELFPD
jgi:D-sedoheptulose 7-phosphate isomerase